MQLILSSQFQLMDVTTNRVLINIQQSIKKQNKQIPQK